MSTDYKTRIREAILADLPDHDTLYNAPGQIGDGRLDGGLDSRLDRRPSPNGDRALKLAAVLVPVVDYKNEPKILLTRRADHLSQHSGQVAFPGGKVEAEDGGPVSAALREAQEEIGLAAKYVDVAGSGAKQKTVHGKNRCANAMIIPRSFWILEKLWRPLNAAQTIHFTMHS